MKILSLEQELKNNDYPGRGIVIGRSEDGTKAVTAYFIMGRSSNSRNRVCVTEVQTGRPESDHLCAGQGAGRKNDRDKRRPDGYDIRWTSERADF